MSRPAPPGGQPVVCRAPPASSGTRNSPCYKVGDAKSGSLAFAGWTVFMSSTVIFSTLLGIFLREWQGVSGRTKSLLAASLVILVVAWSTIGYGNYLKPTDGVIAKVETMALVVRTEDDMENASPFDAKSVILDGRRLPWATSRLRQAV